MPDATLELIEVDGGPEASIAFLNITLIVDLTTMGFWIASSLTVNIQVTPSFLV